MSKLLLNARIDTLKANLADVSRAVDIAEHRHQEVNDIRDSIEDATAALKEIRGTVAYLRTAVVDVEDLASAKKYLETLENADAVGRASRQLSFVHNKLVEMRARSYSGLEGDSAPSRETLDESIQEAAKNHTKTLDAALGEEDDGEAWKTVLTDVTPEMPELYHDYVDLLRGLALRDSGLDAGMCAIVDELMKGVDKGKMSKWKSLTVPSLEEAISVSMARIIRLGYGDWSLWSLPLAAAQYGKMLPRDKRLRAFFGAEIQEKIGPEVFPALVADAFATYAMGPAYASASIVLKLDPSKPPDPAVADAVARERAIVILDMLGRLDVKGDGVFEPYRGLLSEEWDNALGQNGNDEAVAEERAASLVSFTEQMFTFIEDETSNPIAYDEAWYSPVSSWHENLLGWHDRWVEGEAAAKPAEELIDVSSLENTQRDFRHALNAAWLCRLDNPSDVAAIEAAAKDLLKLLAEEAPPDDEAPSGNGELSATTHGGPRVRGSAKQT